MKAKALLLLLLVPMAGAVEEADAPSIDARIERVWHEPAVPAPGEQWQGFIQLADGHNVTDVLYQICLVGQSCFAPHTQADFHGGNVWGFDTNDYGPNGEPVHWGINFPGQRNENWLVGVQYFLGSSQVDPKEAPVPEGVPVTIVGPDGRAASNPECDALGWQGPNGCAATHYFTFEMPGKMASDKGAPGLPLVAVLAALIALAARRR